MSVRFADTSSRLSVQLDAGPAKRAAVGLLTLATDQTLETEFNRLAAIQDVGIYVSRLWNDRYVTPRSLADLRDRIAPALELILPGLSLNVVGFGCTSASIILGEEAIFREIGKIRPNIPCTTPITSAIDAFKALDARKIGLITPYIGSVNKEVLDYFQRRGITIAAFGSFELEDDHQVARVAPDSICDAIEGLAKSTSLDAVFVSCTSLRLKDVVEQMEARTGIPVTGSGHAFAWHCLRLAGVQEPMQDAGRLFELPLPA